MARSLVCLMLVFAPIGFAARMSMHAAAEDGQVAPLKAAIDGRYDAYEDEWKRPDINGKNKKGHVALHLAACNKKSDDQPVKALLEKGADANIINNQRVSARAFINPAFNAAAYMARRVPRPRTAPVLSLGSLTPHYRRAPSRRVFPDPGDGSYSAPVSPAQAWPPHLPGRFDPAATR